MVDIDVDEIAEINYLEPSDPQHPEKVQVIFKNGVEKIYEAPELSEILPILNHWTPPTA
jgi:hypothetical protein